MNERARSHSNNRLEVRTRLTAQPRATEKSSSENTLALVDSCARSEATGHVAYPVTATPLPRAYVRFARCRRSRCEARDAPRSAGRTAVPGDGQAPHHATACDATATSQTEGHDARRQQAPRAVRGSSGRGAGPAEARGSGPWPTHGPCRNSGFTRWARSAQARRALRPSSANTTPPPSDRQRVAKT